MNFTKQHKLHLTTLSLLLIISIGSLVLLMNEGTKIDKIPAYAGMTNDPFTTSTNISDYKASIDVAIVNADVNAREDSERDPSVPQDDSMVNNEEEYLELYTPYSLLVNDEEYNLNLQKNKEYSVYQLMQLLTASSQKPFMFKTKEYTGIGHFVESINGVENNPKENEYWIYYINGESAKMGISQYVIKEGDQIKWKFEESKF